MELNYWDFVCITIFSSRPQNIILDRPAIRIKWDKFQSIFLDERLIVGFNDHKMSRLMKSGTLNNNLKAYSIDQTIYAVKAITLLSKERFSHRTLSKGYKSCRRLLLLCATLGADTCNETRRVNLASSCL